MHSFVQPIGSLNLCKWPNKQITLLDGSPLQQYVPMDQDVSFDQLLNNQVLVNDAQTSKRRRYCFITRKPKLKDPPTSLFKMSMESVQQVSSIDCCETRYCQHADRDMLMTIRKNFWGSSLEARTNFVYAIFSMAWHRDLSGRVRYNFRVNGRVVCCRA